MINKFTFNTIYTVDVCNVMEINKLVWFKLNVRDNFVFTYNCFFFYFTFILVVIFNLNFIKIKAVLIYAY